MTRIMIGNDDGIASIGIDVLAQAAKLWGEVDIVAPATQQTGRAKSMTFKHPLRVNDTSTRSGITAKSYTGTPADGIIVHNYFFERPDVVLSGINAGENTTIHSILTSGTVAVAMEAGLQQIPSFAFSIDVPEKYFFQDEFPGELQAAASISIDIAKVFLEQASEEFWRKSLFVNVNYPDQIDKDTAIVVCEPDTHKYRNYLQEQTDPSGQKYYWLWGDKREDFDPNRDSYQVYTNKTITISPISFEESDDLFKEAKSIAATLDRSK